jgi:hypothetical protein
MPAAASGRSWAGAIIPRVQTVVWEFETRRELDEAVRHLWDRLDISGELSVQRLPEGRWRLELVSERNLRSATLEKVGGRLVGA